MSAGSQRSTDVFEAAYVWFARHTQRTTMDDIAQQVALSWPTPYLTVRNEEEAFQLAAPRMMDQTLSPARKAAAETLGAAARLLAVLEAATETDQFDARPMHLTQPAEDRWSPLHLSQVVLTQNSQAPVLTVMLDNGGHYPLENRGRAQIEGVIIDFMSEVAS